MASASGMRGFPFPEVFSVEVVEGVLEQLEEAEEYADDVVVGVAISSEEVHLSSSVQVEEEEEEEEVVCSELLAMPESIIGSSMVTALLEPFVAVSSSVMTVDSESIIISSSVAIIEEDDLSVPLNCWSSFASSLVGTGLVELVAVVVVVVVDGSTTSVMDMAAVAFSIATTTTADSADPSSLPPFFSLSGSFFSLLLCFSSSLSLFSVA